MNDFWLITIGFLAGWAVKCPFLIKYYRQTKADREHIESLCDNIQKQLNEKRKS